MVEHCYWEEGSKRQWIFCASDNSPLDRLREKVDLDALLYSTDGEPVNLGLRRTNDRVYSGNYVGLCRLKDIGGKNILSTDGREVVLKIEPRFDVSVAGMLNALQDDDEFERYLAPQTVRIGEPRQEADDLIRNELFHFFDHEDPIRVNDGTAWSGSIISASVFLCMLKDLCGRPLMGSMLRKEENLAGKVKGKVLFSKNIRANTLRGRDDRVYCGYLQYSEDILENQILKAALCKTESFLQRYFGASTARRNSFREMALYCRGALSHVSQAKITRQDMERVRATGCYVHYRPVISAAKMVLNEITVEANGRSRLTGYVVPYAVSMSRLFELYARACLKRAGVRSCLSEGDGVRMLEYDGKARVLAQSGSGYADYIRGNVKPDIVLYDPEHDRYAVFDVKYKNPLNSRYAREDRLQLLAYALMYDCDHVGIIFPSPDGEKNVCYEKNEIESVEHRRRYYHQLELAVGQEADCQLLSAGGGPALSILQYVREMTQ